MTDFGKDVTSEDIVDTLSFFDNWEDRYKYIIDLGKELPPLDDQYRTDDHIVRGCQSLVWLVHHKEGDRLQFQADSDAHIVRGLLGIVLAAYNHKTPQDILAFDVEQYFDEVKLLQHLTPTRGNGLRAMVGQIRSAAEAAA